MLDNVQHVLYVLDVTRFAQISFVSFDTGGVEYVNTLAVKFDPEVPDAGEVDIDEMLDAVDGWLTDHYTAMLAPQLTLDRLVGEGILGYAASAEKSIGQAGTVSQGSDPKPLPKECCLVLTLRTNIPGRSYRGRQFIPGPRFAQAMLDNTSWYEDPNPGTFWHQVGVYADALLSGHDFTFGSLGTTAHASTVIHSRKLGTATDVKGYIMRGPVHWLRSRSTAP